MWTLQILKPVFHYSWLKGVAVFLCRCLEMVILYLHQEPQRYKGDPGLKSFFFLSRLRSVLQSINASKTLRLAVNHSQQRTKLYNEKSCPQNLLYWLVIKQVRPEMLRGNEMVCLLPGFPAEWTTGVCRWAGRWRPAEECDSPPRCSNVTLSPSCLQLKTTDYGQAADV